MNMTTPPFRADHVGSLLRPRRIAEARTKNLPPTELHAIEDLEIPALIKMQEDVGVKAITDGEVRRAFWHFDFMGMLDGMKMEIRGEGVQFHGTRIPPVHPVIDDKLGFPKNHPMLEHFSFVKNHTKLCPKISIPGPSCVHFRTDPADIRWPEYKDPEMLFADIVQTYKDVVSAYYAIGCRYLQLDDIFFAYLCDPKQREQRKAMGQDPDWLIDRYAKMLNDAIKDRPTDMLIGMHMCRGNFRSTFAASGGYDAAADAIFNRTDVDIYFMEYDTERAGGLEPLKLLPKGKKRVMAGFITSKTPELESMDWLRRKFDEASKYVDMDQLGIAPQCGFASTEHGNALTEADERRKLELVVETARALWGEA
jgi:5-methyltetrahydropteroyltriglutamate--homocysteine methyltransferase